MPMKVTILGWYNHHNAGDDAFMQSFPLLLAGHSVRFTENIKDNDDSDVLILGGGDVVYPTYTDQFAKFPNKRKIAFSVTLTVNSDLKRLDMFEHVYVRDVLSLEVSKKGSLDPSRVSLLPDVTFNLTPNPLVGKTWLKQQFAAEGLTLLPKVVVCVCSAYMAYNYDEALSRDTLNFLKVALDIAKTADNESASFVFLPFSTQAPWDDRMSNAWVAGHCHKWQKNYVIHQRLDVQQTLNIIAASNVVISTRLHSTVWSTLSGVPFIDLTHHSKNLGFIQTVGKTPWSMNLWEFGASPFRKLLSDLLDNDLPDKELKDYTTKAKEQLKAVKLV
jgi:polysaccharide pyruvyl transferase WcaK-like protein